MKILRQVKVSDNNFGNSTHQLELTFQAQNLVEVYGLFDQWEQLIRDGAAGYADEDRLTLKEAREIENKRKQLERVLELIANMEVSTQSITE